MNNELNNLNDDNKNENNNDLLENNNQENQINYKSNKWKKILIGIIVLIVIFIIALTIYVFVINKNVNNDNGGQGNNNVEDNSQNINYKMEKILDYSTSEYRDGTQSITETEKYYILYTGYTRQKTILYDKNGKDVGKQVFGTNGIRYIYGLYSNQEDKMLIVTTSDGRQALYDKNFNQIIGFGNYILSETFNEKLFYISDSENIIPTGNVGVYNFNGELLIPREYERLYLVKNDENLLFYAKKNGKFGIIDEKNNIIIPFEYDGFPDENLYYLGVDYDVNIINNGKNNYYILLKNGKYGMVDSNNNIIIDFEKERLSYSKYANAIMEENDKKINVYDLNGELKKVIDLGNDLSHDAGVEYYKFDIDDHIFYDDKYIYLLNSNLEFEKYIKPYRHDIGVGDVWQKQYYAGPNVYLTSNGIRVKIHNINDNTLLFKEDFYLINGSDSSKIQAFILCKDMLGYDSYSKCGIIGYDGETIIDFNYDTIRLKNPGTYQLLSQNEKVKLEFKFDDAEQSGKSHINKIKIAGSCMINDKLYELKNNVVDVHDSNDSGVYNSSCNKILDGDINDYSFAYSLNDDLVMTEKYKTEDSPAIYKIYNSSNGELANIGNNDGAIITNGVIGRTLNNEPIVSTDKGIYKIVKE